MLRRGGARWPPRTGHPPVRCAAHANNMGPCAPGITGHSQGIDILREIQVALRFGDCVFDPESRRLFRGGTPVPLSPKAFALLEILVRNRPRAMAKSELQETLWPDTFVVEANLANLVAELREGMGEKGHRDGCLRTVHGFGYAFSVDAAADSGARPGVVSPFTLVRDGRPVPLAPGENVPRPGPRLLRLRRRHHRVAPPRPRRRARERGGPRGPREQERDDGERKSARRAVSAPARRRRPPGLGALYGADLGGVGRRPRRSARPRASPRLPTRGS